MEKDDLHSFDSPLTMSISRHSDGGEVEVPGVVAALGELGPGALVNESGLAKLLGCHPITIRRGVKRGELPVPVRMFGKPTWTAGSIVRHVEARLAAAAREARILIENST